MKTLDEVISDAQKWLGLAPGTLERNALSYLMMYRSDKAQYEIDREQWETAGAEARKAYEEARDKHIARLKELEIGTLNDPLTIEEIGELEKGTPLWVEEYAGARTDGKWMLYLGRVYSMREFIESTNKSQEIPCDAIRARNQNGTGYVFRRERQGKEWNAYRKERTS